uniref:Zyg-11 family member, cell cycle regulator, like n=1 Tax=Takifugu rubripes TaxID=31033 RepID=A0A674MYW0_TAKRU
MLLFHQRPSVCLSPQGLLNDTTVGIFRDGGTLRLRRATVRRCPLSPNAFLLALCPHRLQELDASWASGGLTGAAIVSGLASNPECRSSLQRLSLDGLRLDWESLVEDAGTRVGFSSLRGLRTLKLANTDLSDAALADVCSLPHLESLDISCSGVSNLSPLLDCKNTLRHLIAHRLQRLHMAPSGLTFVLRQLDALRHLDFSEDHVAEDDGSGEDVNEAVRQLLEGGPDLLPSLVSLDISGQKKISEAAVRTFVETRGGLVFLGLLATGTSTCDILSTKKNLKVTGAANEDQVCEALRRYRDRQCFVREALVHLYNLIADTDKPRPDILKLVLAAMQSHRSSLHVHVIATACVFSLTTQDLAEAMPLSLLGAAVAQLLHAMKTFPNHQQVQKNCLLALCSEHILQEVPFDKSVCFFPISNLTNEQLLAIVQQKAMVGALDSSLKFALTALWNLTDEMPSAGRSFIECRGLELYQEVLESYYGEPSIQQKILGLLNNLAEVQELQPDLLDEDLLEHVLSLLQDTQLDMEVRYFAGGILAQLASRPQAWTLSDELLGTILGQLHAAIPTWTPIGREMVSYRSFQPFCPLLQSSQPPGVQLWAVWAIHLVCSHNSKRQNKRSNTVLPCSPSTPFPDWEPSLNVNCLYCSVALLQHAGEGGCG